jgi:hypothetical protein
MVEREKKAIKGNNNNDDDKCATGFINSGDEQREGAVRGGREREQRESSS